MTDLVAIELRTLRRQLHQLSGRLARHTLMGKVHPGSQDLQARTVQLELGIDDDGAPILSPPVRWQEPGAGRLKVHAVPADNEQMMLHSPSGTIGTASLAVWATYDDDNGPPSDKDDEAVWTFGDDVRVELRGNDARVKAPKVVVESDDVHLGGEGGERVARIGDKVNVSLGSSAGLWPIVEGSSKVRAAD
ncbi:phage baseplate protein [Stappia indica]|uniref:Type VI secretion system, phage-baseplate injector n=1 Tax=Stappia indica TaxID=538381 RepID=A0A285TSR0_9HYPH|nr:phage baseplate protein [Stappia indica]SOC26825.1 Type VI secretion system, phage-baseplate injector [Stappia indica]